ncbi:hypothetical protein DP107_11700 [Haloglomus irregulare]|jgi:hypothetical protein|uniref:Uncharacterized protein n=1 Tax=Haloglomus irregulare TaxID=2234134 RepID=A0A554N7Y4_9EURY|nr:hypothetical protein [Haloglomus irregulare]TSD13488.1 hypothetical protein DP107_11700 [Haloglomus irregulare]
MESTTDDNIAGQRIVEVRAMTNEEVEREGWQAHDWQSTVVLELESGTILYPFTDPEGNAPGAIFGIDADDTAFALYP